MANLVAWLDKEAWNAVREVRALAPREELLWDMAILVPFVCSVIILWRGR